MRAALRLAALRGAAGGARGGAGLRRAWPARACRGAAAVPQPSRGSAPVQPAWVGGGALVPEGPLGAGSLAHLQEQAGFLPRPEAFDERLKPGFRGVKALFVFFLCNAVPLAAVLWYLREQRASRSQLSLGALPAQPEDVAAEVMRVVRTAGVCFLVQEETSPGSGNGSVVRVDPHTPEGTAYVPPTEPLPLVPHMERNDLTDIFESPPVNGLGFIHFAVSRNSSIGRALAAGHRRAGLLYMSHTRGAYCSVGGQISVLTDAESRRRYWKNLWSLSFPVALEATVRPVAPSAAGPSGAAPAAQADPHPAWQNPDYLLVRLAVAEATLRPAVDGPGRWDARRIVRRSDMGEAKWDLLVAPVAPL